MSAVSQPEVESYIADSLKTIEQLEQRIYNLEAEKLTLEKVASTSKFDTAKLDETLDSLEKLAFVTGDGKEQLKAFIQADSNNIFSVLHKIAALTFETPTSGSGLKGKKNFHDKHDKYDNCGWDEFFSHPVYK